MSKVPAACAGLDPVRVSRVLANTYGDIPAAARELNITAPDLRRLTWAEPHLLDEAHEEMEVVVARAWAELIRALDSDDPRRREWAAERIMSSYIARDHPLAPARRSEACAAAASGSIVFKWRDGADAVTPPAAPIPPVGSKSG